MMISGDSANIATAAFCVSPADTHAHSQMRRTFRKTIRARSSRNHKDACRVICPGSLSLFVARLAMPLDSDDRCVFVFVCVFARPHAATSGAVETLCNSWSAAGNRLPVTHDLADCGSSAHHGRGRVRKTDEIISCGHLLRPFSRCHQSVTQ